MESKNSTTEKTSSSLEKKMERELYPLRDGCSIIALIMIAIVFIGVLLCIYFLIRRIVLC